MLYFGISETPGPVKVYIGLLTARDLLMAAMTLFIFLHIYVAWLFFHLGISKTYSGGM